MHPDHILMLHRQRIREAIAHAEHRRHLQTLRRAGRPRRALSRLILRAHPHRADRTSPLETRDAKRDDSVGGAMDILVLPHE